MKIKTMCTCEVCGTNYEDKNKAEGCENSHKVGLEIERADYLPYNSRDNDFKGFPLRIWLRAKDGTCAVYKR